MFDCVLNTSLEPYSQELYIYSFLGKTFLRKKTGRTKELIFASICWNFTKQTIAFTKKIHNLLKKVNKKIKWLKFLFTSLLKAKK